MAKATEQTKLVHKVQELARTVEIIQGLQQNSLLSISKFADANYTTMLMPREDKIFDKNKSILINTEEPILQEWRDPACELWHVLSHPMGTSTETNTKHNVIKETEDNKAPWPNKYV